MREYEGKPVVVFAEPVALWPQARVLDFRTLNYAEAKARETQRVMRASADDAKAAQQQAHREMLTAGQGVRV